MYDVSSPQDSSADHVVLLSGIDWCSNLVVNVLEVGCDALCQTAGGLIKLKVRISLMSENNIYIYIYICV